MKIKDFKGQTKQELQDKLNELSKQLMELHFKRRSNVEKPHLFNKIKKDIARIHTVINQKEGV
ncbi:MAG: 50S ribosomal protein L29 [Candidatus Omnitrophica bacterium]|nr:50S ribosomal protein L29 [Candidatus Omnitrophota bacterium]MCK5392766.1 50S ribosomal protein L29 [Candidatus Omnitrophota bacterium]MCK5491723.1 50S ribosomal protein L29 [Candidatus Omnitrophota bacterium]